MGGGGAEGETGVARLGIDVWVRPPRTWVQVRVGETSAHEGRAKSCSRHGGHRRLGRAQAQLMRNDPSSMEDIPIGKAVSVHAAAAESILATLIREDPREGVQGGPTRSGRGGRQGCQRLVASIAPVENIPDPVVSLEQGRLRHAEAETRVCVYTPSPSHAVGPKTCRSAPGVSLADELGTSKYG